MAYSGVLVPQNIKSRYRRPSSLRPLCCWDRGFESRSRNGCLSLCFCFVLFCEGRGLFDGLITRPKESYRMSKLRLRNFKMREPRPDLWNSAIEKKIYWPHLVWKMFWSGSGLVSRVPDLRGQTFSNNRKQGFSQLASGAQDPCFQTKALNQSTQYKSIQA
jgi:hypothetical protein